MGATRSVLTCGLFCCAVLVSGVGTAYRAACIPPSLSCSCPVYWSVGLLVYTSSLGLPASLSPGPTSRNFDNSWEGSGGVLVLPCVIFASPCLYLSFPFLSFPLLSFLSFPWGFVAVVSFGVAADDHDDGGPASWLDGCAVARVAWLVLRWCVVRGALFRGDAGSGGVGAAAAGGVEAAHLVSGAVPRRVSLPEACARVFITVPGGWN